ncbi:glycosyltransferase family 4 protein [Hespellia stercorisuis]|uniref:Glycosyltransferase involved in cell wall bisynthesis n=1 Tax=Hespellia stercorisuis DSM 15480 TaxID=1121950 RepID=A0A1M6TE79_9FIRM|nr:glycosyltransferase family 1 protein [Hespellia stercorisuis]SHK55261.1 Glycosyltransferase involved in cell wall bisynthesis [Hespellia stercorisuis DSM 15480]
MKILIDLTSLADNFSGIERFAMNISIGLINQSRNHDFILFFKNEINREFLKYKENQHIKFVVLKGKNKLIFNQVILPKALYKYKADRYFFPAFPDPILFFRHNVYTTIHDLGCWDSPDSMTNLSRKYFKISYRKSMKFSEKILTVSNFSKRRITKIGKISENKIHVIYNGINEKFQNNPDYSVLGKYNIPSNYILTLSTLEPRKNLSLLIKAYERMLNIETGIPELVLAGRKGWKMDDFLSGYGKNIIEHIHFTGFIDDEDLSAIYSIASLFVFPTKYEGFGIPPLESMACGTPVVSSDAASMTEVLGDAALFFESDNIESFLDKMKQALEMTDNERNQLIEEGYKQVQKFSWDRESKRLLSIIEK